MFHIFREDYRVDLTNFWQNESIDKDLVFKEIIEGEGYVVIKGLFDPDDIKHARETILYLINKQGSKATHFQVLIGVFWRFENIFKSK